MRTSRFGRGSSTEAAQFMPSGARPTGSGPWGLRVEAGGATATGAEYGTTYRRPCRQAGMPRTLSKTTEKACCRGRTRYRACRRRYAGCNGNLYAVRETQIEAVARPSADPVAGNAIAQRSTPPGKHLEKGDPE